MKKCLVENCFSPIFSHGYCQRHQWKRSDEKYLDAQRKVREKRFNPVNKKDDKPIEHSFGYDNQTMMFMDLWHDADMSEKGVICPFTGEKLNWFYGKNLYWNCFAHILPKKNYPYFKLNPANIRIVHPEFHRIIDQGTLKDRKMHPEWKWDEWDKLVLDMKQEYIKFKKLNLLP